MRRLFSTFAHGAPAIGLLLLRLLAGLSLAVAGADGLWRGALTMQSAIPALWIVLGTLLIAGLWTPIASALAAVAALGHLTTHPAMTLEWLLLAVVCIALALLGPGAWSVDARLYGWKQIKIGEPYPDRDPPG